MIKYLRDHGGEISRDVLVEDVAVLFGASRAKLQNTIDLLLVAGVIESKSDRTVAVKNILGQEQLSLQLVDYVISQHFPDSCGDAMRMSLKPKQVWIDAKRAPGRHLGIATLLVELGVFRRTRLTSPLWRIDGKYAPFFLEAVAQANETFIKKTFTKEELQRKVEQNLEDGTNTENWVVSFEQKRLKDHPLTRQIRRISDDHVDAGFDVASFRDSGSLSHNWLIEVKSYTGLPRFYWTSNEIERAKREGERYVLYLVDRTQIGNIDYEPTIITGPYDFFVGLDVTEGWNVVASEFKISAKG